MRTNDEMQRISWNGLFWGGSVGADAWIRVPRHHRPAFPNLGKTNAHQQHRNGSPNLDGTNCHRHHDDHQAQRAAQLPLTGSDEMSLALSDPSAMRHRLSVHRLK
jgi:hypothetical protein